MWSHSLEALASLLESDLTEGLSKEEGARRLQQLGPNSLPIRGTVQILPLLLAQCTNWITWLLIGAALVAASVGEVVDASAIVAIVLLNGVLSFFQEYRAERSLEALRRLEPSMAKVIRSGKLYPIATELLVPGDLVLLEAGDKVPADGRIVRASHLIMNESSLTGESHPVFKETAPLKGNPPIGDQINMAFMGSVVMAGSGALLVTATGSMTQMGAIASELVKRGHLDKTPLQKQLDVLGKRLVVICMAIVASIFLIGIARGLPKMDMLLMALSLAVAAIPEGLPAIVTISLSIGVRKMAKDKALIRRLSSVETLGSTQMICTDKTGTLTENVMAVSALWVDRRIIMVSSRGYAPEGTFESEGRKIAPSSLTEGALLLLKSGVLCNRAELFFDKGQWQVVGDPTEGALIALAEKALLTKGELEKAYPLIDQLPFDPGRKMMSVLRKEGNSSRLFVKGGCDPVLALSTYWLVNGKEVPLTDGERREILLVHDQFAEKGSRVLGIAYRIGGEKVEERDLVFIGLVAINDPIRSEVKEAIEAAKGAGIAVVMVTGDHKKTAQHVAESLGLEGGVLEGKEIEKMGDEELEKKLKGVSVCARISPVDKLRIVKAFQSMGNVTAMTGDGVNDATALHAADIGIAMGITGTDVTRESSDMVLLDDNFASIIKAVERGRGIYDNIVKSVCYLLSSNMAEILILLFSVIFAWKVEGVPFVPLLPVQILWMNFVTDGLPAIALALDPPDPWTMRKLPRPKDREILHRPILLSIGSIALLMAIGALITCFIGLQSGIKVAQTMTFTVLIFFELVRVQMIRLQYRMGPLSNPYLIVGCLFAVVLQIGIIYIPEMQPIFNTTPLTLSNWTTIGLVAIGVWVAEIVLDRIFHKRVSN